MKFNVKLVQRLRLAQQGFRSLRVTTRGQRAKLGVGVFMGRQIGQDRTNLISFLAKGKQCRVSNRVLRVKL